MGRVCGRGFEGRVGGGGPMAVDVLPGRGRGQRSTGRAGNVSYYREGRRGRAVL